MDKCPRLSKSEIISTVGVMDQPVLLPCKSVRAHTDTFCIMCHSFPKVTMNGCASNLLTNIFKSTSVKVCIGLCPSFFLANIYMYSYTNT